ncbi:MAG TPA: RHS repeat-associated core domain-containing protein [Puia sp.]
MSVYTAGDGTRNSGALTQSEAHVYGSSRLGILNLNVNCTSLTQPAGRSLVRGNKLFELPNHLGNVLVTISDKKLQHSTDGSTVDYYTADAISANDYYAFGSPMPGRAMNTAGYRYGFNGKENDNEVKGVGDQIDYGMRVYDPRVGRFYAIDPITQKYPALTPYQFASNSPIAMADIDGMEGGDYMMWAMLKANEQQKKNGYTNDQITKFNNDVVHGIQESTKTQGKVILVLGAAAVDVFATKGWLTRTLLASQLFGAFPHTKASTPEGRVLQDQNSKEALTDALVTWGAGKILGVALDVSVSGLRGLARNRLDFAKNFYETAGFAPERAGSHMNGIDLTKKVVEETYKKGTVLEQWTYIDKDGHPIMGDYYALPGADPSRLGIPLEGRVKTTIVLNEDTKFLQSTSADIKDWTPGSNRELKGGETQLFQTGVKYKIKK